MKERNKASLLLASLSFGFTLSIFAPGEFLSSHSSDFWFGWRELGWSFVAVFCVVILLTYGLGRFVFRSSIVFSALLTALTLTAYIQGNYINPNYGLLDGTVINWSNYTTYGLIDTILWVTILVAAIFLAVKETGVMVNVIKGVSVFLIGVQVLTLATVGVLSLNQEDVDDEGDYELTTDGMFDFSADSNVIVFLADAYDTDFFTKLIVEKPELFADWDGFVYYPDFVGSYTKTCMSVPFIFTGVPYKNDITLKEYEQTICADTPFFNVLSENEYDICLYTDDRKFAHDPTMKKISNFYRTDIVRVTDLLGLLKDYYKLSAFRYAPHILKPYLVTDTATFSKYKGVVGDDKEVYKNNDNFAFLDYINQKEVTTQNQKKAFRFYHVAGAHYPITMDENLNCVEENTITVYQQAEGVVVYFSELIRSLKEKGIYDNATIIFTADHGKFNEGVVFPVFALKLPGQTGEIRTDSRPLWAKDIRNIILNAVGIDAIEDNISDPLHSEEVYTRTRQYYQYSGDQSDRLPDLYLYNIKPGPIPLWTGTVFKTDGTVSVEDEALPVQIGSYLTLEDLLPYAAGLAQDHWSIGAYTAFALPVMEADHDLLVSIDINYWKDEVGPVIVSIPDARIGEFERDSCKTDDGYRIEFSVPASTIDKEGKLYIRLAYPSMAFELKASGDIRRIGLFICGMRIQ